MKKDMTIAEKFAERFRNGYRVRLRGGHPMKHFADNHGARITTRNWVTTLDFPDGSRITWYGGKAWGVGFPNCLCWKAIGHTKDCAHA